MPSERVDELHARGVDRRPGSTAPTTDDGVGGVGAFFLLLDEPEVYGLPPDPVVPTRYLARTWSAALAAAGALVAGAVLVFTGRRR